MAGVSTGISLLTTGVGFIPRTLGYTATTTPTRAVPISEGLVQMYLQFAADGLVYSFYSWDGGAGPPGNATQIIGSWATPTGNHTNPENFSLRMTYISGLSPNQGASAGVFDVWHNAANGMQCIVSAIPPTVGSYSITFRLEIRDSNLTTQVNTIITLSTTRT